MRKSDHKMSYKQCKKGYINIMTDKDMLDLIERIKRERKQ